MTSCRALAARLRIRARRAAAGLLALAGVAVVGAGPAQALDPTTDFGDYLLERWTAEDGLPQITVLTVTQDSRGYLWVGTQNGIARFDGRRFATYSRANTGLDLTLPSSSLASPDGAVWFGSQRGLLRHQDGRFEAVPIAPQPTSVRALALWQQQLVAATVDGLRSPQDPSRPQWLGGESLHALAVDARDRLWAGGEGQLFAIEGSTVRRFALPTPELRVLSLAPWMDRIALGTRRGVWLLDPLSGNFEPVLPELAGSPVASLHADRDGNLWAASVEHLARLRPGGDSEIVTDADFLPRPWLHVIFEDREGDLWLGSQRESLLRLSDSPLRVFSQRQGLHDPLLWSLLDDGEGGLWVGSNSGLSHWREDLGFVRIDDGAPLPDPTVYSLHRDPNGTLWLGTRAGVARLRPGSAAGIEVDPALAALGSAQVTSFADDVDALWIGSLEGLFRWHQGRLERRSPAAGSPESRVRSLHREADGSLLVGTEGGLRRLRGEHWDSPDWASALEGSFVSSIRPLGADALLLTTLDKGIAVLQDNALRLLDTRHGLPSANAWTSDLLGAHVYLSTNDGAYRMPLARLLDPANAHDLQAEVVVRAVNRARGDQRMGCCNGGGHARSARSGQALFYPTTNGIIRLDTTRIPAAPQAPALAIESAQLGKTRIDFPSRLRLEPPLRDLALQYAGIHLRYADGIEFRYRLQGYSKDWTEGVDDRAVFTGLPPGQYGFELEARFPGRAWARAEQRIEVSVLPHWHERIEVRLLALAALVAALLGGWRYSLRAAARRRAALEQAVQERTVALARVNERLRNANAALLEESRTDALTGSANRRALLPLLADGSDYALLLIDLDHFKALNDRHGHAAGDQVLVQTSALLREGLASEAKLARWGGEEFLIVWPRLGFEAALAEAEHLRARISQASFETVGGQALRVSCSIGVACHPPLPGRPDWQLSLELADRALYRAKAAGRNRVEGVQLLPEPGELLPEADAPAALEALAARGALQFSRPRVLRLG